MSDQALAKNLSKEEPKTPGGIFTRESEETIRSPEKLNEHIRAVTTGTWILIAALALVMAALRARSRFTYPQRAWE